MKHLNVAVFSVVAAFSFGAQAAVLIETVVTANSFQVGDATQTEGETVPATTPAAPAGTPTATSGQPSATLTDVKKADEKTNIAAELAKGLIREGFSIFIDLDHGIGLGTFVPNRYDTAYLAGNISLFPRYAINLGGIGFQVSARWNMTVEYTMPDSTNARRVQPLDLQFGFSAPNLIKEKITGLRLTPSVAVLVPTTPESWQAGMIATPSAALRAQISLWKFSIGASGRFTKNFQASQVSTPKSAVGSDGFRTCLGRSGTNDCAPAVTNNNFGFSAGGDVTFIATDALSFQVSYTYLHQYRYAVGVDEFSPKITNTAGNSIAKAMGDNDITFAYVGASYQLTEHFSCSLGVNTFQAPLTNAGYVRFPFLAINNLADNATTVNFTLSAAY